MSMTSKNLLDGIEDKAQKTEFNFMVVETLGEILDRLDKIEEALNMINGGNFKDGINGKYTETPDGVLNN